MLIFAVSMFCLSFRVLDSLRYKTLITGSDMRYAYGQDIKEIEFPFRVLPIWGPQINQEQYLKIARNLVHRLKSAGAKVVIVPVPDFFMLSPQTNKTLEQIEADSIVVFGAPGAFNSLLPWERDLQIENKNAWWAKHPFSNRTKVPWGVMSPAIRENSPLVRFVPVGFRENDTGEPVSDVATVALRRFFGIPDCEELPFSRSRLLIGPLSILIAQDGVSYIRLAHQPRRQSEISVAVNYATDSLEYYPAWDQSRHTTITTEEAWLNHKGSIVMLDWNGAYRNQSVYYGWAYQQIFGSAFSGSFLTTHNEWNVLLITTIVVLLSVFSYAFRNGLTVLISFLLAVAVVLISVWLFISYNVLFEPIYIVVPIVLCGFILPLVKLSGEKRIAEEKIKSLEEENQRLLDLQRSVSPHILPSPNRKMQ
jgi:hypothetical protein